MTTTQRIEQEVNRLDQSKQIKVLEFARALARKPMGVKLQDLQQFTGSFSPKALAEVESAIEEGCEGVDAERW